MLVVAAILGCVKAPMGYGVLVTAIAIWICGTFSECVADRGRKDGIVR